MFQRPDMLNRDRDRDPLRPEGSNQGIINVDVHDQLRLARLHRMPPIHVSNTGFEFGPQPRSKRRRATRFSNGQLADEPNLWADITNARRYVGIAGEDVAV